MCICEHTTLCLYWVETLWNFMVFGNFQACNWCQIRSCQIYSYQDFVHKLLYLCLQILSRLGHMSYDVVGAQIIQTGIPSSKANLIGTTEVAVASLAESIMLGVAIIANDPSHFGCLAMLSLLSVVGAAWMFCRWLLNPTDEQKSLFSYYPQLWYLCKYPLYLLFLIY